MKYYILKNNSPELLNSYLQEFGGSDRAKIELRCKASDSFVLVEKTEEVYTNVWTVQDGCPILWEKYTKKRVMYDYTGIVNPLIHLKGKVYFFEQYQELLHS